MSVILLESGSHTLLESGDWLLEEDGSTTRGVGPDGGASGGPVTKLGGPQGPVKYGYTFRKTGSMTVTFTVSGGWRFDLTEQIAEEDDLLLFGVI